MTFKFISAIYFQIWNKMNIKFKSTLVKVLNASRAENLAGLGSEILLIRKFYGFNVTFLIGHFRIFWSSLESRIF
jgi:hypothetical protein